MRAVVIHIDASSIGLGSFLHQNGKPIEFTSVHLRSFCSCLEQSQTDRGELPEIYCINKTSTRPTSYGASFARVYEHVTAVHALALAAVSLKVSGESAWRRAAFKLQRIAIITFSSLRPSDVSRRTALYILPLSLFIF